MKGGIKVSERFIPKGRRVAAVLACGGRSQRLGRNKLLEPLGGVSCIRRSAEAVLGCPDVVSLVVAAPEDLWEIYSRELSGLRLKPVFSAAGATRAESVKNASLLCEGDIILIHDGARPLVTPEEISASVEDAARFGSSVVCTPAKDTVRISDPDGGSACPPRERVYTVRTPQTFSLELYRYALENASGDFTDDAQLLDAVGISPHITLGKYSNIKLTTEEDVAAARAIIGAGEQSKGEGFVRIGQGYDVHRLTEGRKLILGGVDIPYNKGLLGHSDADVLVHTIMDAVLGAAAMGDIGKLFPDTDERFRGADSLELLKEVCLRVRAEGFEIGNIDSTVLAQAPKLSPHIDRMRENIASAAGIPKDRVSVKATTEEGLGFTGAGEGIAAQAVAVITG